ncbi:Crp/Fnr family transcriptional regulator [Polynucleobacter sp. CS-Odin-A6]|uniref:Crp/Fnr family transcriptional regulator n=1 Tax=Polynucleobacter sp. CS-Odin-A6 TaxID=2689106 RepID=UPI001C0A999A|nr:Crp/Fnr family transcriptional regulator [Polynucleobacter sp. CS-Odin-A6]MBU3621807.1 Crp/Fnr family transcriptional regulator [Polynucleobacter sp. CS-Odin-A6]
MNRNFLLNLLPKINQELIFSKATLTEFKLSQIICIADKQTDYIYFPIDGFISITQSIDEHPPLEVGMIGREGMLGAEHILGINTNPFGALVQGIGSAWKIAAQDFLLEIQNSIELKDTVSSYLAVRNKQLGLSVACEHFHEIGPRFAKWLLMSQDRAQSPAFLMTHEFIALMLGVRRVGITTIAADFRRRGLIEYHRGEMKVLNRVALKAEACSCYLKNRKIFTSMIG